MDEDKNEDDEFPRTIYDAIKIEFWGNSKRCHGSWFPARFMRIGFLLLGFPPYWMLDDV